MYLILFQRRVGVKRITAVIPYFGYSRQDVRTKRGPVAASDVANMLQSVGSKKWCGDWYNLWFSL